VSVAHRLGRLERLNRCPTCGFSVVETREALTQTLERIRRDLPEQQAKALIGELKYIWTGER
jgi:hypothetical protein